MEVTASERAKPRKKLPIKLPRVRFDLLPISTFFREGEALYILFNTVVRATSSAHSSLEDDEEEEKPLLSCIQNLYLPMSSKLCKEIKGNNRGSPYWENIAISN